MCNKNGRNLLIQATAALAVLLALIIGLAAQPQPAAAATCTTTVTAGGDIQAAITAAAAGDVVCLEPGTYTPAATILINKALTLQGPMWGVDPRPSNGSTRDATDNTTEAIITGNGTLNVIIRVAADDVVLDGFVVTNGNGDLVESPDGSDVENVEIRNLIVHNALNDEGIQMRDCNECLIEFNYVYDTFGDGINLCCGSTSGVVQFNEVYNSASTAAGIYVYQTVDSTIQCNLIDTVTGNDGIRVSNVSGPSNLNILNNVITNVEENGISVSNSNVTVLGNDITDSRSDDGAIYITDNVTNVSVQYNNISNNTLKLIRWGGQAAGVLVGSTASQNADTILVQYNNIVDNTPNGVSNFAPLGGDLDAQFNWWGDSSGPSGQGPGTGDAVSTKVNFANWLVTPVEYDRVRACSGTINIYKEVISGDPTTVFEFDPSWSDDSIYLKHGEYDDSPLLLPGTYSIEEVNLPPGWSQIDATCELNDEVNPKTADPSAIPVEAGESWNCIFSNTYEGEPPNYCPSAAAQEWTDILGKGMGSAKKHKNQVKIVIPNWQNITHMQGQMVAKDNGKANWARFILPGKGNYVQVHDPYGQLDHAGGVFWYDAILNQAKNVKGKWNLQPTGAKGHIPRALLVYPTYSHDTNWYVDTSMLVTPAEGEVHWDTANGWTAEREIIVPIEPNEGAADFKVKLALVDNDKDKRPVWITVDAGGVTQTVMPDKPSNGDLLNIISFTLEDVPAGTDEVVITLYSPSLLNDQIEGDSAAIVGITANYQCELAPQ